MGKRDGERIRDRKTAFTATSGGEARGVASVRHRNPPIFSSLVEVNGGDRRVRGGKKKTIIMGYSRAMEEKRRIEATLRERERE